MLQSSVQDFSAIITAINADVILLVPSFVWKVRWEVSPHWSVPTAGGFPDMCANMTQWERAAGEACGAVVNIEVLDLQSHLRP